MQRKGAASLIQEKCKRAERKKEEINRVHGAGTKD